MALAPTIGTVAILKIGTTTLPGLNWKINFDGKMTKNVSNFRDGRLTATTLPDAQLTFRLVYDDNSPPTLAGGVNLRIGAVVTVLCYIDATNFWTFPGVVTVLGPENPGVEDVVGYDITVELSGTLLYPGNG